MKPRDQKAAQGEIFKQELEKLIKESHPLVKLSKQIDWERFDVKFGELYQANFGRPAIATRTMVGLTYLKYLHDASDEAVLELWVENPYWQYFCGERYFQHEAPCDRSQFSRWRKRIGESGAEEFLQESLAVVKGSGLLKMQHLKELYVDTTVQEKNISYPSDANLLNRARKKLVRLSELYGVELRQKYTRIGRNLQIMAHRYAAAKQWNRARRCVKKLRTILGRIIRDIERKVEETQRPYFSELLSLSQQLFNAAEKLAPKLYSLHEPATEAIAKGKIHKRFEYGVKVSVVTTRKGGYVLGSKAIHGNPYDGHTLKDAVADVEKRVGIKLFGKIGVDLGYRGHDKIEGFRVFHPRLKKLTKSKKLFIRARSKVEATISYLKRCFRMARNYLKGKLGDIMNAIFAGAACNLAHFMRRTA